MSEDLKSHGWLIHKRGRGWYRPDAKGYTPHPWEAGRYSHEEAMSRSHPNGPDGPRDGMTIKHESGVTGADGSLKSRLLQIDHGDGGSQWARNPDGAEAVKEIERLEEACTEWAEVSQRNYLRAKVAEAEVARLRSALESAKAALKPIQWLANLEERKKSGDSVMINVSLLRTAAEACDKLEDAVPTGGDDE